MSDASPDSQDVVKDVEPHRARGRAALRAAKEAPVVATKTEARAEAGSPPAPVVARLFRRVPAGRAATTPLPSASSRHGPPTPPPPQELSVRDGRVGRKPVVSGDVCPVRAIPKQRAAQPFRREGRATGSG